MASTIDDLPHFTAGTWPNLPLADLEIAMQADLFKFAMPVQHESGRLVIR